MHKDRLTDAFREPPREFGFMPFWFWNDDLKDAELIRQIREFHAKGCGGFIPHPRIGLSRRVGYLTPEFFRLIRVAVEEAARLDMKVVLYDEGSYPSGTAQGRVVAENPDWAAKCIFALHHTVTGPARGYWRPDPGRALGYRLVSVVAAREIAKDTLDPDSLRCLPWDEHELVFYDVPEGNWRLVAVWEGHSGGIIRGVFEEEEDGHALAPPAADILREDAVACFIRFTHDQYYQHLQEHFGTTVVGMFTDEPSPMGRVAGSTWPIFNPMPWTPGFLKQVQPWWNEDVTRWLPALWLDSGPRTQEFRWVWRKAVQQRLEEAFYKPIGEWCAAHGIALTGHAGDSNEMGTLRRFQWPGQDLVWRYVTPDKPMGIEEKHSLTAKAASSAARLGSRRFNVTEVFGAYGWKLTFDEMKWLLDWHFVRGTNLIFPHAAFYSIRGRRAYESEPDLAVHNVWWPHFGLLGEYGRRLCWLFSDGAQICETAILSDGDSLAWEAASILSRNQQDFIFIDDPGLRDAAVDGKCLVAGAQRLKLLIVDKPGILSAAGEARVTEFSTAGGTVLRTWTPEDLAKQTVACVGHDVEWQGELGDSLRVMHYRKGGLEFYLLVNEGEQALRGHVVLAMTGGVQRWEATDGTTQAWPAQCLPDGRLQVPLRLERREAAVFAIDPRGTPDSSVPLPPELGEVILDLVGPWRVTDMNGKAVEVLSPGDWARTRGWETFSGTLCYRTTFNLSAAQASVRFLDLGRVGDIAEIWVNDRRIGVRAWAPYVADLGDACQVGTNCLEVRVTNSMANAYDGSQLPSGLIGPVRLLRSGRD